MNIADVSSYLFLFIRPNPPIGSEHIHTYKGCHVHDLTEHTAGRWGIACNAKQQRQCIKTCINLETNRAVRHEIQIYLIYGGDFDSDLLCEEKMRHKY